MHDKETARMVTQLCMTTRQQEWCAWQGNSKNVDSSMHDNETTRMVTQLCVTVKETARKWWLKYAWQWNSKKMVTQLCMTRKQQEWCAWQGNSKNVDSSMHDNETTRMVTQLCVTVKETARKWWLNYAWQGNSKKMATHLCMTRKQQAQLRIHSQLWVSSV